MEGLSLGMITSRLLLHCEGACGGGPARQ